jgi:hypothetical protein
MRSGQGNTELEHKFLFGGKKAFNQKKKSCASKYMQMGKNTGKKTRTRRELKVIPSSFFHATKQQKYTFSLLLFFVFLLLLFSVVGYDVITFQKLCEHPQQRGFHGLHFFTSIYTLFNDLASHGSGGCVPPAS